MSNLDFDDLLESEEYCSGYQQGVKHERGRIVKELEELKEDLANYSEDDIFLGEYRAYESAIKIVRGGENE